MSDEKLKNFLSKRPMAVTDIKKLTEAVESIESVLGVMGAENLAGHLLEVMNSDEPTEDEITMLKGVVLLSITKFIDRMNSVPKQVEMSRTKLIAFALETATEQATQWGDIVRVTNRVPRGWYEQYTALMANMARHAPELAE